MWEKIKYIFRPRKDDESMNMFIDYDSGHKLTWGIQSTSGSKQNFCLTSTKSFEDIVNKTYNYLQKMPV